MKLFQNDNLYIINNKEMVDTEDVKEVANNKDQKPNLNVFNSNVFKPKLDIKQLPLSWRTKFGFSLGHFFNDAVCFEINFRRRFQF